MRTIWKTAGIELHPYFPVIGAEIHVVTGVDFDRKRLTYDTVKLLGVFKVSGIQVPSEKASDILVALVERQLGVSLNEFYTGMNISDGCYTLYNDTTTFCPTVLRAVFKSMDTTRYGARVSYLKSISLPMPVMNRYEGITLVM